MDGSTILWAALVGFALGVLKFISNLIEDSKRARSDKKIEALNEEVTNLDGKVHNAKADVKKAIERYNSIIKRIK